MIKIEDLQEAIAECQGVRNPTSATCIKLAAYYTILDHLENKQPEIYSYTMPSIEKIDYKSNSEFGQLIDGKDINDILPIIEIGRAHV